MKKLCYIFIFTLLFIVVFSVNIYAFSDVSTSDWFYSEVQSAANKGWVKGYEDGTFRPNNNVTWAEALTMVLRSNDTHISDLPVTPWYLNAYSRASDRDLFPYEYKRAIDNAENPIAREDLFRLLYYEYEYDGIETNFVEYEFFTDLDYSDLWKSVPINTLANIGIISGYSDGDSYLVKPTQNITRAELCALLSRANNYPLEEVQKKFNRKQVEIKPGLIDINYGKGEYKKDIFEPIKRKRYKNYKGTEDNPISIYEDTEEMIDSMIKNLKNGEFYFYVDTESCSVNDLQNDLGQHLNYCFRAAYNSVYPTFSGLYCSMYTYGCFGDTVDSLTLYMLNEKNGNAEDSEVYFEERYSDYLDLVEYVQNDLEKLYENGSINNSMSDKEKAIAVAKYISENIEYDSKISSDLDVGKMPSITDKAHNPIGFYKGWDFVCDGYAGLFNVFMNELGIETYMLTGSNHAWNLSKLDGKWLVSDLTAADSYEITIMGEKKAYFKEYYIGITYEKYLEYAKGNRETDIVGGNRELYDYMKMFVEDYLNIVLK